jgi:thiamine pyrophosphate-dependent acetolactate synthase large subunit-like protein
VAGRRVDDPAQLHDALRRALRSDGPALLEIEIA